MLLYETMLNKVCMHNWTVVIMTINWYSPIMWSAHFDIFSPTMLVTTHRYSPSLQDSMLLNISVAVSTPWTDPPEVRFSHSPLWTPSTTGFHCHWYLSGSVPVAWTVNDTGLPETVPFNSCGWAVIFGGSAREWKKNRHSHNDLCCIIMLLDVIFKCHVSTAWVFNNCFF